MENEKTTLYVAFSTQKDGVGTTNYTVLAASDLYYLKGNQIPSGQKNYAEVVAMILALPGGWWK